MAKLRFKWWVHFPGEAYANDFDFKKPVSEAYARKYIRNWAGVKRLSRGTEIWAGDY